MSDHPGRVFRLIYSSHSRVEREDSTTEQETVLTFMRESIAREAPA